MSAQPIRLSFEGASGAQLAARLDLPAGPVRAYALFAHCFTCSKDLSASRAVSQALAKRGIATLRFDFTGLGGSGGEFASTNFTMNVGDLKRAAEYLAETHEAPSLLIGHSLGGAAVIVAAAQMPSVRAVATINAPADAEHVTGHFGEKLTQILDAGEAEVLLGQRPFTIRRQFLDDLAEIGVTKSARDLRRPLLVLHAPGDETVPVDNAAALFQAARHPKSFVSLDTADHLLTDRHDADYAAEVIAAWASRYLEPAPAADDEARPDVVVRETGAGRFQVLATTGRHHLIADEPETVGGDDTGPSPYDLLATALGACTAMTLRMYAERKGLPLDRAVVTVRHEKVHEEELERMMAEGTAKPDRFTRVLSLEGDLTTDQRQRLLEIAGRCPVHKTLEGGAHIDTELSS
ncbi:bifunctional alpha/beta hydrolase/OsmC family protein [Parvularcula dongshanensis]|uniref:Putative redox protein n=1 Tax=Parvularcula dongshanensis TaxID=1173995 RepID=A0A840I7D3_9PROT|nr:bifunctional alpha/beta hydrolase/OsmC family protein [Parvularcula dongshanensis]MBB4660163.1 putative redox protein [Parvularcula dongshanensis]